MWHDLVLPEAAVGCGRATFLGAREGAELRSGLRQHREAQDSAESRAMLKMIIVRVVADDETAVVHYRPEAEPWVRTA